MRKEKKRKDPVVILLDVIILAMTYVIILLGIKLYENKNFEKQAGNFMQDANEMSFELEKNDYATLIQGMYVNQINNYTEPAQYHELAKYTEAAVLYKVYEEVGKDVKAREQKTIMDDAILAMGSLRVFANKVDVWIRDFGMQ